ncbi:peptidoglycan-binding protein [Ructibacterium gallinarum]|uniref:Peptidoglycan-binding protein n=1 Tax=Ructibacterium gallinarum TaxID=2779355 RepID=A0A9D5M3Q1_9FIRM|nr:peptidoglycan-binding protein [Ructibacterium gallinarum]MBE5040124.1 peptidoglycan-binding protein [Ructibacterium gallinarum]
MAATFYVPQNITVHLGAPDDTSAPNVTVPFVQYIKNVASSEIYPTWPESAIRANIYAQISYALNRIFTEHYRSRGYNFDITNSTQYDQAYIHGRDIFENISQIVDDIFNDYIVRQGKIDPLFARYCNGTTSVCPGGLSQWGTVELAKQGYTPYEILSYYFGEDINIITDAPVADMPESYPGTPLRLGSYGEAVNRIQIYLNRIAKNYPAIPKIEYPDGVFDLETEAAVKEFQRIFNLTQDGIVGKATWYKIFYIFTTVKRLAELDSEGITLESVSRQYKNALTFGDRGEGVRLIQYFLNVIAEFNDYIPAINIDGIFGPATQNAVKAFQQSAGLPETGVVDETTWNALLENYNTVIQGLPPDYRVGGAVVYPGEILRRGMSGENIRLLQSYLTKIADTDSDIPKIPVTGYFGEETEKAVLAFQKKYGIPARGIVGLNTWNAIAKQYDAL